MKEREKGETLGCNEEENYWREYNVYRRERKKCSKERMKEYVTKESKRETMQ